MNVNFAEIGVVCIVALLLFGPEQLPQIARQLGKFTADLRKVSNSVKREWYNAVYPPADELRRDLNAGSRALRSLKTEVLTPPSETHQTTTSATDGHGDSSTSPDKTTNSSPTQSS